MENLWRIMVGRWLYVRKIQRQYQLFDEAAACRHCIYFIQVHSTRSGPNHPCWNGNSGNISHGVLYVGRLWDRMAQRARMPAGGHFWILFRNRGDQEFFRRLDVFVPHGMHDGRHCFAGNWDCKAHGHLVYHP